MNIFYLLHICIFITYIYRHLRHLQLLFQNRQPACFFCSGSGQWSVLARKHGPQESGLPASDELTMLFELGTSNPLDNEKFLILGQSLSRMICRFGKFGFVYSFGEIGNGVLEQRRQVSSNFDCPEARCNRRFRSLYHMNIRGIHIGKLQWCSLETSLI